MKYGWINEEYSETIADEKKEFAIIRAEKKLEYYRTEEGKNKVRQRIEKHTKEWGVETATCLWETIEEVCVNFESNGTKTIDDVIKFLEDNILNYGTKELNEK